MKLSAMPSFCARSCIRREISISGRPSGTSVSLPQRSSAGISSNRSSIFLAPMAASMSRMSASVCGTKGIGFSFEWGSVRLGDDLLVALGVEHLVELGGVARLEPEHPALAVRILVQRLGRPRERGIALDHFAADRRV